MTPALVVDVRGLCKAFGPRAALRDVDFAVAQGELIGLVGPNGAGKSTLLRALIGLVGRDAGEVTVLGRDPAAAALAIRQRCCYLPGETSVYASMTCAQFLDFALGFYARRQQAVLAALQREFVLPPQLKVRNCSAGMKQKLAILATLGPDVDLYLLDEPDRALDASVRFCLRDTLLAMKRAGKTIVLSSHHLSEVETLADRLEFLVAGRIVPAAELTAAKAQLGRRLRLRLLPGTPVPAGVRELARDPDGTLVLETGGDPVAVLQQLPRPAVLGAELGIVRLEDLYKLLLHDDAAQDRP